MLKQAIKNTLRQFGYDIHSIDAYSPDKGRVSTARPPSVNPVWPFPRHPGGPSDDEMRREFAKYDLWHYAYEFEGGLSFSALHDKPGPITDTPDRPLQRFRHFMPDLIAAQGGSLQGKRILDIACNSGFWSIQCALLGAEVVGFDARDELIEQANLIKSIVGVDNVEFKVLDFWDMNPQALGGTFDAVLSLGILYHLPKHLEALELTTAMSRKNVLLDTNVYRTNDALIKVVWEEPTDIRMATTAGVIYRPSRGSIDLMLKHVGASEWFEIPIRNADVPPDYREYRRAAWLIEV